MNTLRMIVSPSSILLQPLVGRFHASDLDFLPLSKYQQVDGGHCKGSDGVHWPILYTSNEEPPIYKKESDACLRTLAIHGWMLVGFRDFFLI